MNLSKETRESTPFIPDECMPRHNEIAHALDGDNGGIDRAFLWDNTPQGHKFWRNQHEGKGLNEEGTKIFLATLLRPNTRGQEFAATPTAYKMAQDAKTHGYIR